ncbi:MAG: hypothetical protein AAGD25_29785 [Cyanobacteria bacterium P01_F01_bin.150]
MIVGSEWITLELGCGEELSIVLRRKVMGQASAILLAIATLMSL